MAGWAERILIVDLNTGKIEINPLSQELKTKYLGGRGINSWFLYQMVKPGIDPLSPENPLIFGTGPLSGTLAPASRFTVTAKSPLTGILGDANCGGGFSAELKWAGYDHIVIQGVASKPVYLWINDDQVELRDASNLWGKTVQDSAVLLKQELGDPGVQFALIGPAGENLVRLACVIGSNYRGAARTGMGAVMGSKKLKAIAVRGTRGVKIAKPKDFSLLMEEIWQMIRNSPVYPRLSVYGTPGLTTLLNERGYCSVRNLQQSGGFDQIDQIDHEALMPFFIKSKSCVGCIIHCGHFFAIKEGPFAGEKGGGIEFGSIGPLGTHCGISYAPAIFKITSLCNQYGVDVLGFATILGFAMEWYQRGIITLDDLDGIPLEWGNYEATIKIFHKMIQKEGIGGLLGDGAVKAAAKIGRGAEKYITHSKGLEWGHADIRAFKGYALNQATATRGADHLRGIPGGELLGISPEEAQKKFGTPEAASPTSYNKARMVIYYQNLCTLSDALEICKFNTEMIGLGIGIEEMRRLLETVTGIEMDRKTMLEAAERIYTVERAFLVREGIRRKDDALMGKQGSEPVVSGPFKGEGLEPEKFNQMLDEYYELRGWNKETGIPTRKKLEELGLNEIADELDRLN
jgi:aldehyde:ferredoxin oxidoreductase